MPFIAGVGVARCSGLVDREFTELIFSAASAALADARMDRADIDGVCLGASDQLDGRAISSMQAAGPAGGFLRDEVKVSDDGALALATAMLRLEAGLSRHLIVASWTKSSESPPDAALGVNPEPVFTRSIGMHPLAAEAAITQAYLQRSGLDTAAVDALAASLNGQLQAGPALAYPLRTDHMPAPTDAAIALVLSADKTPVEIAGLSWGTENPDPTRRRLTPEAAVGAVVERACADAGLRFHRSLPVETTDRTVFRLCMVAAGLGLVGSGDVAGELLERPLRSLNASGGLWRSNPIVAAGLERVVEAAGHVRGGAEAAVAHSVYGFAGQGQFAAVLRRAS